MSMNNYKIEEGKVDNPPSHYYGDVVRRLFLAGAILMAITLPFILEFFPTPIHISLFGIIILGLVAGLISPQQKWVIIVNFLISLGAFAVFEYFAVITYMELSITSLFFWINQVLAVIFLISLYYASKTFRGVVIED